MITETTDKTIEIALPEKIQVVKECQRLEKEGYECIYPIREVNGPIPTQFGVFSMSTVNHYKTEMKLVK